MNLRHIFWENKVKYVKVVTTIHLLKYKKEIKMKLLCLSQIHLETCKLFTSTRIEIIKWKIFNRQIIFHMENISNLIIYDYY